MDWRPSDGLEVDDEDLDGLRQKPSNGPEACSASIGHGSSVHGGAVRQRWCKPSDGLRSDSDGLEKPGATVVLQPECMARRRTREALAASAQNRHPSYQDLASGSRLVKIEDWAKTRPRKPAK